MKIVLLDSQTVNPGDLSWEPLEQLGDLEIYPRSSGQQAIARCQGAEAVVTNKVVFDEAVLAQLPDLKYIGVSATGINVVDTEAAARRGIVVTNVPAYSTDSVAQMAFALLLELTSRVSQFNDDVRQRWPKSPDFAYYDVPPTELAGLVMGIVGFGRIGQAVAAIAKAMGMTVIVTNRSEIRDQGVRQVELEELLRQADVVSLHCPQTEQTAGMINAERIQLMKPSAILLNLGRGGLIDEQAVADALNQGRLAGAGVDVLSTEPPAADNPMLSAKNCVITPHVAWATTAARKRLLDTVTANIKAFQDGSPINVVN
ncbi:MAG: D-2-hydroxyacid dehydrogenase [Phycisphaerae bacterium]